MDHWGIFIDSSYHCYLYRFIWIIWRDDCRVVNFTLRNFPTGCNLKTVLLKVLMASSKSKIKGGDWFLEENSPSCTITLRESLQENSYWLNELRSKFQVDDFTNSLSVCLSVRLIFCLFICLSICLSICQSSVFLSICLSVYMFVCLFVAR